MSWELRGQRWLEMELDWLERASLVRFRHVEHAGGGPVGEIIREQEHKNRKAK